MPRFKGQAAFISGAARGQGRAHAIAFAREGADVAIFDICRKLPTTAYDGATPDDLQETVAACEAEGVRVLAEVVDVRDATAVAMFAERALAQLGKIDIVVANAGILQNVPIAEMDAESFAEVVDVNLKGVFNTIRPVLPGMIERSYGRVIATGSIASLRGFENLGHYVASKHGIAGLIKTIARECGRYGITANYVVPNTVNTTMIQNPAVWALVSPDDPTSEGMGRVFAGSNGIPEPWIEPDDVSKMVLFAASPEAAATTGSALKVDLGATI